jgi:hypothetical protein
MASNSWPLRAKALPIRAIVVENIRATASSVRSIFRPRLLPPAKPRVRADNLQRMLRGKLPSSLPPPSELHDAQRPVSAVARSPPADAATA